MIASSAALLPDPLPGHPRLIAKPGDWEALKERAKSDAFTATVLAAFRKRGDELLAVPPVERTMKGRRLLDVSRTVLERVGVLAVLANVTGDDRYSRRAAQEMMAAARFSDWNPSHYLDTAEMSLALAIGYDWLFEKLTPDERDTIAGALIEKGINPSFGETERSFVRAKNNWNQVCHSGLVCAAIAIADRDRSLAEKTLERAIKNLPSSAGGYAPEGVYPEGAMYWNYGTTYYVILASALERLTGSDQGLAEVPGFSRTADYIMQVTTPTGEFYPYADSRPERRTQTPLFWLARRFQHPEWLAADLSAADRDMASYVGGKFSDSNYRFLSFVLLWRDPSMASASGGGKEPPRHWLGRGETPLVVHRSAFGDPGALYVSMKGGSPSSSHAHMDAGSFVLQSDGMEWAADLGMQGYESLEKLGVDLWNRKQDSERWKVFRVGPESHNIPRFDGGLQLVGGHAEFVLARLEEPNPRSVLDLTSLYQEQVSSVKRGLQFVENKAVLFQDEWTAGEQPVEVVFQWITPADVSTEPGKIMLKKGGKELAIHLLDPAGAKVTVQKAADLQKPYDSDNPGISRISIATRTEAFASGMLRLLAVPKSSGEVAAPPVQPLGKW